MTMLLFPEKSRDELEMQYQAMTAALWLAAQEKVGRDPVAINRQIDAWLLASLDAAATAAVMKMTMNLAAVEGVKH